MKAENLDKLITMAGGRRIVVAHEFCGIVDLNGAVTWYDVDLNKVGRSEWAGAAVGYATLDEVKGEK